MQSQPTPERLAPTPSGVLVVDGYGVRIRVDRGRLVVVDGTGRARRAGQFERATARLRRLVLLGHTGSITLDAMRWLSDVGVGLTVVDSDGRLLVASAGMGRDDPRLRRAQALAIDTLTGDAIARRLISEKIAAQAEMIAKLDPVAPVSGATIAAMRMATAALHLATSRDEIRLAEAQAAGAFWQAWSTVPVTFARREADRVPAHWRTFGTRASPLTGSSRVAGNPANAILNYLYAILESEARLACLAMGLDPGMGVLHADLKARDSLALDVMEPVRPSVDAFVLDLLGRQTFRASDFHETRQGSCRVLEPLTHRLAETGPLWARRLGPVVERVARLFADSDRADMRATPTPLTGSRRSSGRARSTPLPRGLGPARSLLSRCQVCAGELLSANRTVCDACLPERQGEQRGAFSAAGRAVLAERRAAGADPAHSPTADGRRAATMRVRSREVAEWDRVHGADRLHWTFGVDVLPLLAGRSASELAAATGLTRQYCRAILRGERVPHARWWGALRGAISPP